MSESDLIREFLQHRRTLMAYVYAIMHNRDAAEEVFQELGLAVTDHARRGTEVKHFIGWAVGIARRQIAAYYRENEKQRRMLPWTDRLADALAQAVMENKHYLDREKDRYLLLEECIEELTGRNQQVIEQRYQHGKSNTAIAEELGWKVDSVKVALSRVRKLLGQCVERKLWTESGG